MLNTSLNKIKHLKDFSKKASLAFITIVSLIALCSLCCGKRTPPVPPTERVSQRASISGLQQGNQIVLSWRMPARNGLQNETTFIDRIDVYRLAEPLNSPEQITEADFSAKSTLIKSIPVGDENFSLKTFSLIDNLEFSTQTAKLRYAIRFVNKAGQKAAFSNFLTIEPSAKIAGNPENLSSEVNQETIVISWEKPQTNVDGSTPVNILGYNIYRKSENDLKKLNSSPVSETLYADNFFDFDKRYSYTVRTVSVGTEGNPVESLSSAELDVTPRDIFAPSSPASITIAASPDRISLFFAANPEKDIAGYKIFRSTDSNLPLNQWEILTSEPIKTNTFQDQNVKSGIKYFYYLTAIDNFGNVSQPSRIVSETAP